MSKILVTGCAGLIGSHFSKYLLDKGHEVYGIDDFSGGYRDFVDKRISFFEGNLINASFTDNVFAVAKPDVVYHFAAYAAEGLSPFIRNFNYTNNLIVSVNVINNCIRHNSKLVFTSSMAVYGEGETPFLEIDVLFPTDPYGIAKYAVEMDIRQAADQFGLNYTIVRPHNIIGTQQNIWDRYRNVIGIWIRQVLTGEPIIIFGDGEQKRAFSDIKYFMEPLEKLITKGTRGVFNLGADQETTINQAAHTVAKVARELGYSPTIVHREPRHEVRYAFCDHFKAKERLGFNDKTNLEETVREMFTWAKEQPDRPVKVLPYELDKGMYSYWK